MSVSIDRYIDGYSESFHSLLSHHLALDLYHN